MVYDGKVIEKTCPECGEGTFLATESLNKPLWGSDWELLPEDYLVATCDFCGMTMNMEELQ